MARICILSQFYLPEMGAPQGRLSELAERLIDLHWDVEVLTALPNYPTGEVMPGYDTKRPCVEKIGRVRTVRVPLYTANSGFFRRLRCYLSFAASASRHGPDLCRRPDVLYVESPPLFIGRAARRLAKHWRCPFVLNISDLWPESAIRMGVVRAGWATAMAERFELSLYRDAAGVTGQSTEIIASIRRRSPGTPTAVITNGVDPDRFFELPDRTAVSTLLGAEPGPVFLYAGLLGLAQGLDQLLDLAKSIPADVPGQIVLVGDGPMKRALEARIRSEAIDRVKIMAPRPREEIPQLLAAADVAIISLGLALPGAVPSKIYEAMAASLPILLIASGEPVRRVQDAACGLVAAPGDSAGLLDKFCRLAADAQLRRQLGIAGRQAAETTYNRTFIAEQLDEFLRSRLGSPTAGAERKESISVANRLS